MAEVDITAQIKLIESLKCALLADVSSLYEHMRVPAKHDERDECLARLVTHTYLLAGRLGLSCQQLDKKVLAGLKQEALKQDSGDIGALLKYWSQKVV